MMPYCSYPSRASQQQQQQYYPARATTMVTAMSSATCSPSPYSFPGSSTPSASVGPVLTNQPNSSVQLLRFNIILQASTAATQISEGSPTTYLNRGQAYAIHLQDTCEQDMTMRSTFIIMFHEPSHRKVALNYWKFWLSQQKNPSVARAIVLDQEQSAGIHNVQFPSFDRVEFDWNGRVGAKLSVRFNCLSTDFSRIKGVKGIPLRAQMETKLFGGAGTSGPPGSVQEYVEQCYCKIKLFRDKGAERKNKDDAKQIVKHLERVYAEGNPRQHPFWLMYNQPKPYSVMSEIPTTPQQSAPELHLTSGSGDIQTADMVSLLSQQQKQQQQQQQQQQQTPFTCSPGNGVIGLSLYINIKTTQHQRFHSLPSPTSCSKTDKKKLQLIVLDKPTVRDLIVKLSPILSLHHSQVSEVLWRQPKNNAHASSTDTVLVVVNDQILAEHFVSGSVVGIEWEIKSDGTVRLLLQ
ncbi:CP2 transcription factor-domain-containing protein [Dichotomocladium elegans]|nr:CP2 transcription factor-domain-containing protein [Dichotomocladium elegans]